MRLAFISIHAPVKGATHPGARVRHRRSISIHAPVKGATGYASEHRVGHFISIHAPVKGATLWSQPRSSTGRNFNPRSREGSDPCPRSPVASSKDFNPRSREGSDWRRPGRIQGRPISIHAPVKGATKLRVYERPDGAISIHAPVKGATAGRDPAEPRHRISIHAPVKGATSSKPRPPSKQIFQSTLP